MIRHALAAAILTYVVIAGAIVNECRFLADLRNTIFGNYGMMFLLCSCVFILNLFAGFYLVMRKLALKDTGDKLAHVEKQLRGQETVARDLTERILERK